MLNVINIQLRRRPEFLIKILHSFSKDQYDPVLLPYSASGVVLIPALIKEFAKEKGETNADMNVCRDSQRFFYLWQFFFFFFAGFLSVSRNKVSLEEKLSLRDFPTFLSNFTSSFNDSRYYHTCVSVPECFLVAVTVFL